MSDWSDRVFPGLITITRAWVVWKHKYSQQAILIDTFQLSSIFKLPDFMIAQKNQTLPDYSCGRVCVINFFCLSRWNFRKISLHLQSENGGCSSVWLERWIVVPEVAGSSPVFHPTDYQNPLIHCDQGVIHKKEKGDPDRHPLFTNHLNLKKRTFT